MNHTNVESDTDLTYHDLHPDSYKPCQWDKLVKQLSKRFIRDCRLDVSRCEEEATEVIERIEEDYDVCAMHYKIYEGLKDD
jgi:hypothetical protein